MDRGYAIEKEPDGSPRVLRGLVFDLGSDPGTHAYDDKVVEAVRSVLPRAVEMGGSSQETVVTACSVCQRIRLGKGYVSLRNTS